jgi:hypothetical protein
MHGTVAHRVCDGFISKCGHEFLGKMASNSLSSSAKALSNEAARSRS